MQNTERENPLLESNEVELHNGEIILKGNLTLLNLNLSRMFPRKFDFLIYSSNFFFFFQGNYLTLNTVEEFLHSVQYQIKSIHFNDTASFSSTTASLIDFSGLCRLELKVKIFEFFLFNNTSAVYQGYE
jgi:hypothetical protein